jgi:hypothetical protein
MKRKGTKGKDIEYTITHYLNPLLERAIMGDEGIFLSVEMKSEETYVHHYWKSFRWT